MVPMTSSVDALYGSSSHKDQQHNPFLCDLHKVCSHTMLSSDLFVDLSTRVKHPSRGLVREPGYKFVSHEAQQIPPFWFFNVRVFLHELVLLIQDNTSGPGLCYRCRLYKSFYDL